MSQSLVKNLIHLVYSTKNREPWIPKEHRDGLFAYQAGIFKEWDSPALLIGGVEDHIHALFSLSKNHALKKIVEEGVRLGEFRRDLDLAHLLVQFIGSCFIYHSNRISLSQGLDMDLGNPSERARGLSLIHTLFFDGISATPRGSRKIHPKAA